MKFKISHIVFDFCFQQIYPQTKLTVYKGIIEINFTL